VNKDGKSKSRFRLRTVGREKKGQTGENLELLYHGALTAELPSQFCGGVINSNKDFYKHIQGPYTSHSPKPTG